MQSCQDGSLNSMIRHAAEHVAMGVDGKAETGTVAMVGVDIFCTPVRGMYGG